MIIAMSAVLAFQYPLAKSTMPGNVLFDPLRLADTEDKLYDYRVAELKHGRLAMLAAVAYPAQETLNPTLSGYIHLPNLLAGAKLSPSLVNGALEPATVIYLLGLGSGLELYQMMQNGTRAAALPADYRWRLTSAPDSSARFSELQAGEVWNGRLAMVAVLGYVVQEAVTGTPVLGDFLHSWQTAVLFA